MAHSIERLQARVESVFVHVDATMEFTTATIVLDVDGASVCGLGVAKRNRTDEYDAKIGYSLAVARALIDAGDDLEQVAYGE